MTALGGRCRAILVAPGTFLGQRLYLTLYTPAATSPDVTQTTTSDGRTGLLQGVQAGGYTANQLNALQSKYTAKLPA